MTGLLLGADPQVRSWISFYIRNGQKKHNESLAAFRAKLLDQLKNLIMEAKEYQQRDGAISQVFFFLFSLTDGIFKTGAHGVLNKSQNPTILGQSGQSSAQIAPVSKIQSAKKCPVGFMMAWNT